MRKNRGINCLRKLVRKRTNRPLTEVARTYPHAWHMEIGVGDSENWETEIVGKNQNCIRPIAYSQKARLVRGNPRSSRSHPHRFTAEGRLDTHVIFVFAVFEVLDIRAVLSRGVPKNPIGQI